MKRFESRSALVAAVAAASLMMAGGAFAAPDSYGTSGHAHAMPTAAHTSAPTMNMYGGQAYLGKPALAATAALVKAGGGEANFSFAAALTSMLGEKTVKTEVAKLTKQYGQKDVNDWINGSDGAVNLALKHMSAEGFKLPAAPANLHGVALAKALVKAGTTPDGTFWAGRLYDVAFSHKVHNQVMDDINANPKLGSTYDGNVHRITNQAMYDVAQALSMKNVKLAAFH
jgi:hypothetical protein